jgi:hypothetical protein
MSNPRSRESPESHAKVANASATARFLSTTPVSVLANAYE